MSRFDYVKYDEDSENPQLEAKTDFIAIAEKIENLGPSRAASLALTKLEEAYMWVGKAIRDNQIARSGSATLQEERKNG